MRIKNISILFLLTICAGENAFAQQDSLKKDSTQIYEDIENYSKRSNFTKFIYRLVFKPVETSSSKRKVKKKVYRKLIQKPYSTFEGKIIRNITIETLDPFGYSIADTIVASQNFALKTGNALHVKSRSITIRNLLLIHKNQRFDSLLVKESERLVRKRGYVRDVKFFVKTTAKNSDSVDIFIRELDIWSIIPKGDASTSSFNMNVTDENFLGLGHESQIDFTKYIASSNFAYNANYHISNIRNTYINSTMHYGRDEFKNSIRSFALERPFFSSFAKWAAGISFSQQFRVDSISSGNFILDKRKFRFNEQDYWAGNAMQLFKGNTENNRTTNFISTARILRIRYLEKPAEALDPQHVYANENFYLTSIGIATRKYVQDKFIFQYGVTEDVPIGKVYSVTVGYQVKNKIDRYYLGMRFSSGFYYSWGYLSTNAEYGTFFRASNAQQGAFTVGVNYFSGLFEIRKWKFRQFAKPEVTFGLNRFLSDSITLNDGYGLDGFNSSSLSGTNRLLLTLQTQAYSPWNFIGFRFGPYLICSLGMLGNTDKGFRSSKVYSQIGLGVLIKNENLVFNTFQLSLAFYPFIPGNGRNIFKPNSFKTTDFGFRDFVIGKPAIVTFQ